MEWPTTCNAGFAVNIMRLWIVEGAGQSMDLRARRIYIIKQHLLADISDKIHQPRMVWKPYS